MLATISCLSGAPVTAVPEPHTPAGSAWLKPAWADHEGYAPPPPGRLLHLGEPFSGELDGALLVCEATTTHRGDRQRILADLRGHDTTRPDMDVWMTIGDQGVLSHGPDDSTSVHFGAPAVSLRDTEGIGVSLQDRGVFRKVTFDTMHAGYAGELPLALLSESSEGQCLAVPDELVEAELLSQLDRADELQPLFEQREVDLSASDFGSATTDDPRPPLRSAASVVGWGEPRVRERVERVDSAQELFRQSIGGAMTEAHGTWPDQVQVDDSRFVAHPMECPRWLGYRRYGLWSKCGIEVQVGVGTGSPRIEVVDGSGTVSSAGVLLPIDEDDDRYRTLEAGEVGVMVIPIEEPAPPYALRIWGDEGPVWLAVPR